MSIYISYSISAFLCLFSGERRQSIRFVGLFKFCLFGDTLDDNTLKCNQLPVIKYFTSLETLSLVSGVPVAFYARRRVRRTFVRS